MKKWEWRKWINKKCLIRQNVGKKENVFKRTHEKTVKKERKKEQSKN